MPADDPDDPLRPDRRDAFTAIIDVRSPAEYAEDHVPGAINLPVLDDAERARVGAVYVRVSKFEAKKIGAALVARNIARHLEGPLADQPGGFAPLVYCWRGGQRSGAMATVLGQIGWRVETVSGGYKRYRRRVMDALYHHPPGFRAVVLDGDTGAGKTAILQRLAARGVQTLDLEGLAAHRGSVFGAEPNRPQPGQKWFESLLLERIERLDPARPVVIEAESSRIGARQIPPLVWKAMDGAPRIALSAPAAARARYSVSAYPDLTEDPARLEAALERLAPLHGRERVAAWRAQARAGAFEALAEALIREHYDPAYARSRRKRGGRPAWRTVRLETLTAADQERAADAIAALVETAGDARPPSATAAE